MALSNTWKILVRDYTSDIDFTSRTLGFSTEMNVPYGSVGTSSLSLTLLNNDGALTPGGGGTYTSTDWFQKAIVIDAYIGDNYISPAQQVQYVFAGLVTDFVLEDDGRESTVTITAVDALTKLTQSGKVTLPGSPPSAPVYPVGPVNTFVALSLPLSYLTGWDITDSPFPKLGAATVGTFDITQKTDASEIDYFEYGSAIEYASITDLMTNGICNSSNSILYPYSIYFSGSDVKYGAIYLSNSKTRDTQYDFSFTDVSPLTLGTLGFTKLDLAFETPNLINRCTAIGSFLSATEQVQTSSSSQDLYGMRSFEMGSILAVKKNVTMDNDASTEITAQNEIEDVKSRCQENVNRKSASSFEPQSLSFTFGQVKQFGAESTASLAGGITSWGKIVDSAECFWNRLYLTWTGAGASSQSKSFMVVGRTIEATASDVEVTLYLDPYFKNHSFQIGVDRLGESKVA